MRKQFHAKAQSRKERLQGRFSSNLPLRGEKLCRLNERDNQ